MFRRWLPIGVSYGDQFGVLSSSTSIDGFAFGLDEGASTSLFSGSLSATASAVAFRT